MGLLSDAARVIEAPSKGVLGRSGNKLTSDKIRKSKPRITLSWTMALGYAQQPAKGKSKEKRLKKTKMIMKQM